MDNITKNNNIRFFAFSVVDSYTTPEFTRLFVISLFIPLLGARGEPSVLWGLDGGTEIRADKTGIQAGDS